MLLKGVRGREVPRKPEAPPEKRLEASITYSYVMSMEKSSKYETSLEMSSVGIRRVVERTRRCNDRRCRPSRVEKNQDALQRRLPQLQLGWANTEGLGRQSDGRSGDRRSRAH